MEAEFWTKTESVLDSYYNRKLALYLIPVVVGLLYAFWKQKKGSQTLNRLPGPRRYFLGGYLNLLEFGNQKKTARLLVKWCREYGPVYRVDLGPIPTVVLNSPSYVQKVYGSMDINHMKKSYIYDIFRPEKWVDGLFNSEGEKWKSRRKLYMQLLDYKTVLGFIPVFNNESRTLVQKLEDLNQDDGDTDNGKEVQSILFNAALHSAVETVFGIKHEEQQKHDTDMYIEALVRFFDIGGIRVLNPWLLLEPIWRLHPLAKEIDAIAAMSKRLIGRLIQDYKDEIAQSALEGAELKHDSSTKPMLNHLIDAGLGFEGIYEEIVTMLAAGYESTALTLQYVLFMLALNPGHQENCRKEVDSVFDDESLSPNQDITTEGLKGLQYLERCIFETLRMIPPAFLIMRRIDSPVTLEDNLELPAGTNIALFTQGIQMKEEYYPNPDTFDPDRFLPEERRKRNPYAYVPFAGGPRMCVGQKFAMTELLIMSARILRHFIVHTSDKLEDIVFMPAVILKPENPMKFIFEKRTGVAS